MLQYKEKLRGGLQTTGIMTSALGNSLDNFKSLAERRELIRLKLLFWLKRLHLLRTEFSVEMHYTRKNMINGHTLQTNTWLISCYNNYFIPYTVKQWNLLPRKIWKECSEHYTDKLAKHLQN